MPAKSKSSVQDLLDYLNAGTTAFQAIAETTRRLRATGFSELNEAQAWKLKAGGRYFVVRHGTALAAFALPAKLVASPAFRIVGAHSDSPCLKVKAESETVVAGCAKVFVEVYGGPILSTWLDRPLSLAGRAVVETASGSEIRLVDLRKPLAIVPNLAIHLNRDVNTSFEYNKQNHLPLLLGNAREDKQPVLKGLVAEALGVKPEAIQALDLYAYAVESASLVGANGEFFSSGRIDNLAACHAIVQALVAAKPAAGAIPLGILFDAEEVGSQTPAGADSSFLDILLERIVLACGGGREEHLRALQASFLISNDAAHAWHPNFADKHDPAYAPQINRGPVIKSNANFRYATTAETAAVFAGLCREAGVPCQRFQVRSDLPCGSTIGPVSAAGLGMRTVDVGIPMWAMHSCRETAGVTDALAMAAVLQKFFAKAKI